MRQPGRESLPWQTKKSETQRKAPRPLTVVAFFLFYFFFLSCYKFGGTEIGMEINWGVGKTGCDVLFSLGSSFFLLLVHEETLVYGYF